MVGIAQLVERRLVVADVAGSSPVTHPSTVTPVRSSGPGSAASAPDPQAAPLDLYAPPSCAKTLT